MLYVSFTLLLTDPPLGMALNIRECDPEVMTILEKIDLLHIKDTFAREEVTINDLVHLTEEDLKEIGIDGLIHRRRIVRAMEEYSEEKGKEKRK